MYCIIEFYFLNYVLPLYTSLRNRTLGILYSNNVEKTLYNSYINITLMRSF